MEARPPPQAPADPGSPAARREERAGPCEPLAAAAALREDRWGERQQSRSGCQRGPSPAAEGAPPPPRRVRRAPGRGTMASSEEDGGGNGAVEDKENGKKKKKLGALATTWLIFYNVAMTAG